MKIKLRIDAEIELPETKMVPTRTEIEDWIKYSLGAKASINQSNPLYDYDAKDCLGDSGDVILYTY